MCSVCLCFSLHQWTERRHIFLTVREEHKETPALEGNIFQAFAHIMSMNIPLTKANHNAMYQYSGEVCSFPIERNFGITCQRLWVQGRLMDWKQ